MLYDLNPYALSCLGSSVGRALGLDCRVSWVRVPLEAAQFLAVLSVVELFALFLNDSYRCEPSVFVSWVRVPLKAAQFF